MKGEGRYYVPSREEDAGQRYVTAEPLESYYRKNITNAMTHSRTSALSSPTGISFCCFLCAEPLKQPTILSFSKSKSNNL